MANVLIAESFLQGLADLIREKTGSVNKMTPGVMLERIENDWGAGGTYEKREELLPVTTVPFESFKDGKVWASAIRNAPYVPELGVTYTVMWDGLTYDRECLGAIHFGGTTGSDVLFRGYFVGNQGLLEHTLGVSVNNDTGEPFCICVEEGSSDILILADATQSTHNIAVYRLTIINLSEIRIDMDMEELIPETTIPFEQMRENVYGTYTEMEIVPLAEGTLYKIMWDGTAYISECRRLSGTMDGEIVDVGLYVGNPAILDIDVEDPLGFEANGFPFILLVNDNGTYAMTTDTTDSHNISMYHKVMSGGSGEGSSDIVKYVTIMNWDGTEELYVKPTINGDDCVDVIAKGLITKPTEDSTAKYNYTYSGYSLIPGGDADSNALKNVTEDRVLYTAFEASIRSYTITYNDSDGSFLHSESLLYGAIPSYVPEKSGSSFDQWEPAPVAVTGDATYTAKWVETVTFATGSWSDIARISESGEASKYFSLGDTREIPYNGGILTAEIVGFNHDDLADGSGKAGMSILCKQFTNHKIKWLTTSSTLIRYNNTNMHNALQTEVFAYLPIELQSVIKEVTKQYVNAPEKPPGKTNGGAKSIDTIAEKVFIPSFNELNIVASKPTTTFEDTLGTPYEKFTRDNVEAYEASAMVGDTSNGYTTRDDYIYNNGNYWIGGTYGSIYYYNKKWNITGGSFTNGANVRFGFCI